MESQVFINLAVKDLKKSMEFYTRLGFINNPQFSDENGKCMVWNEHILVMLMTHEKFNSFVNKPIADTKTKIAAIFSVSVENIDKVNEIVENGLSSGGLEPMPFEDYGFMQKRNIEDFDGHTWEFFCMDMSKFPTEQA